METDVNLEDIEELPEEEAAEDEEPKTEDQVEDVAEAPEEVAEEQKVAETQETEKTEFEVDKQEKPTSQQRSRKPSPSETHPMGRPSIGADLDDQRSQIGSQGSQRSLKGSKFKAIIAPEEPTDAATQPEPEMVVAGSQPSSRKSDRKPPAGSGDVDVETDKILREVSQANESAEPSVAEPAPGKSLF